MNQHPSVRQRIRCAFQFDGGFADFHAGAFSATENLTRCIDARDQFINSGTHDSCGNEPFVSIRMAVDAKCALLGSNQLIDRLGNRVIAMAGNALGELPLVESCLVWTGLEKFSLSRMALAADIGDRSNAWRHGPVITVAGVACWRG